MSGNSLIKFEGKSLEKLIEAISKGIGTIYRPRAIRKEADAKAYEIEIISRAKNKANAEGKLLEVDNLSTIEDRLINRELKKQKNIDNVAEAAAEEFNDNEPISDEGVNEDWSTRFFNIVEDISDDDLHLLWGKILAGEVKKPKSYSLRTLEFLKNLSKDEAMNFMKVAELAIFAAGKYMVYNPDNGKTLEEKFNISFTNILELKELGLLNADSNLNLEFKAVEKDSSTSVRYKNKGIVFERKKESGSLNLNSIIFTSIGMQLLSLVNTQVNQEYIKLIRDKVETDNIKVKLGNITTLPNGQQVVMNITDIPK